MLKKKKIIYTPGICPYCKSNDVDYKKEHYNGKSLKIPLHCKKCGKLAIEIHYTEYSETEGLY
jgi:predicted Zn-ribbon and HTH transcriptional regulator